MVINTGNANAGTGESGLADARQTCTALAADLMAGDEDPRGHAADLLGRALAALPAAARQ